MLKPQEPWKENGNEHLIEPTNQRLRIGLWMSAPAGSVWRSAQARNTNINTQLNAFVTSLLPESPRSVLKKEAIPHTVQRLRNRRARQRVGKVRRPAEYRDAAHHGPRPAEPDRTGEPGHDAQDHRIAGGPSKDKQKLCFTVPAAPLGSEDNLTYHEATLRQISADLGYDVKSINEGLAVVYSELESTNYTGIGISCGGGLCNVCFSYLSVPVLELLHCQGRRLHRSAAPPR